MADVSGGRLVGLARRHARRAPMQEIDTAVVSVQSGLAGDCKGGKYPRRQITVLAQEAWEATLAELGRPALRWTARRANLLVAGIDLPRARGGIVRIGPVHLEVTGQTYPCVRMEEVQPGLLKALAREWRGGLTCRVLVGGEIVLGDEVEVLVRPKETVLRLPG